MREGKHAAIAGPGRWTGARGRANESAQKLPSELVDDAYNVYLGVLAVTLLLQDYHHTHGHIAQWTSRSFGTEQAGRPAAMPSGFGKTEPAFWFQVNCPSCTAASRGPRMGAGRRAPLSAVAAHAGSSHAGALRASTPSAAHAAAAGQARRERVRQAR